MPDNIVKFPIQDMSNYLRDALQFYKNDAIEDSVMIYRTKDRKLHWHWFGSDSTIGCLGLVTWMERVITNWIIEGMDENGQPK